MRRSLFGVPLALTVPGLALFAFVATQSPTPTLQPTPQTHEAPRTAYSAEQRGVNAGAPAAVLQQAEQSSRRVEQRGYVDFDENGDLIVTYVDIIAASPRGGVKPRAIRHIDYSDGIRVALAGGQSFELPSAELADRIVNDQLGLATTLEAVANANGLHIALIGGTLHIGTTPITDAEIDEIAMGGRLP